MSMTHVATNKNEKLLPRRFAAFAHTTRHVDTHTHTHIRIEVGVLPFRAQYWPHFLPTRRLNSWPNLTRQRPYIIPVSSNQIAIHIMCGIVGVRRKNMPSTSDRNARVTNLLRRWDAGRSTRLGMSYIYYM